MKEKNFGPVMKEEEEEPALFLDMQRHEKEENSLFLLQTSDDFDPPLGSKPGSPIYKIVSSAPCKAASDDFLNSDGEKNDYDWLLTPPDTPLFPSLEMESHKSPVGQIRAPMARPTVLKSRLTKPQIEPVSRGPSVSRQSSATSGLNRSNTGAHRTTSSGGPGSAASRPATPTGRPTLPATAKLSRPSMPTSRGTLPSSRPVVPLARSLTASARSSTPTARPSIPPPKSQSRSATPTRRLSTPSTVPSSSAPPGRRPSTPSTLPSRSAPSATKSADGTSRNPVPSRGISPTVRSRIWQPSEMPGFSLDAPQNLRTSMPERPMSASRGRHGAPTVRSSSVEAGSNGKLRQQSCSPSRGRSANGSIHNSRISVPKVSRMQSSNNDGVSPVLIGTKMVERVVNMRRLVPPKQDDHQSVINNSVGKSSSHGSTGFGRSLSKISLDMAMRHMDIRRSISGSSRPLMSNISAASMYSVRSGPARSRSVSASDSPIATSSNASSDESVNNNILSLDGSEIEDDDLSSERGLSSTPIQLGR